MKKYIFAIVVSLLFIFNQLKGDASLSVMPGKMVTISINVMGGTLPVTFQWQKNLTDITGANSNSYVLSSVTETDSANYTVKVSNAAGTVNSDKAVLLVTALPTLVKIAPQTFLARGDNAVRGEGIAKLFDGNINTKWLDFAGTTWVKLTVANPTSIQAYSITSANDFPLRDPISWTLSGSNDGATWVVIDTRTAQNWATRLLVRDFILTPPSALYTQFKFDFKSSPQPAETNGQITQIAELELFGTTSIVVPLTISGIAIQSN